VTAGSVREHADAPNELKCNVCNGILRDAMSTPCCDLAGCEECLTKALRDNNMACPHCKANDQSIDMLVPNYRLRDAVDQYLTRKAAMNEEAQSSEAKSGHKIATIMTDRDDTNNHQVSRGVCP
jgi:protein MPE1